MLTPLGGPQDLWRCQARYADAVFILCNKYSANPDMEDKKNIMTLLALGQALQDCFGQGVVAAKTFAGVRKAWRAMTVREPPPGAVAAFPAVARCRIAAVPRRIKATHCSGLTSTFGPAEDG
jgi:hypothetical protein